VSRSFTATTSATVGAVNWSIIAKQANDYNGSPGNNLTLDTANSHLTSYVGTCVLSFVTQPKDAKVGANITSVTADPAGTPVRVEVLNGPGGSRVTTSSDAVSLAITSGTGTAGAALTPSTPSANAVNGLASFGFSIGTAGFGYQVTASSSGSTSADSAAFNVADDAVICTGHGCNGNAAKNNVTVNVTAPLAASGDLLEVALDLESLSCPGYTPLAGTPVVTFTVTGSSYRLVTIIVPAALDPRPASQDRVCYGSAKPFTDRSGLTNVNVGLLPDCKNKVDLTSPTLLPCQRSTTVDRSTGAHTVSFYAPFGSTRGRT
jgi:hypothetical protein